MAVKELFLSKVMNVPEVDCGKQSGSTFGSASGMFPATVSTFGSASGMITATVPDLGNACGKFTATVPDFGNACGTFTATSPDFGRTSEKIRCPIPPKLAGHIPRQLLLYIR